MMPEAIVLKFVVKCLKQYGGPINSNPMKMDLWKGTVTFDQLVLLESFLSSDVLSKVKCGTIKHVNLWFPWKKLDPEAASW
jgi:hypothetical protein